MSAFKQRNNKTRSSFSKAAFNSQILHDISLNNFFHRSGSSLKENSDIKKAFPSSTIELSSSGSDSLQKDNRDDVASFTRGRRNYYIQESKHMKISVKSNRSFEGEANNLSFVSSTGKRRHENRSRKSTDGFMRLCEMYEMGKNKIIVDRERSKKYQEEEAELGSQHIWLPKNNRQKAMSVCSRSRDPAEQYVRLCKLYEMGTNKVRADIEHYNKQQKDSNKSMNYSSEGNYSNGRQNHLYALSTQKQLLGKKRRNEVEKANKPKTLSRYITNFNSDGVPNSKKTHKLQYSNRSSDYIPRQRQIRSRENTCLIDKETKLEEKTTTRKLPRNKDRWNRLYELSKSKQEHGKNRRLEIENKKQESKLTKWILVPAL